MIRKKHYRNTCYWKKESWIQILKQKSKIYSIHFWKSKQGVIFTFFWESQVICHINQAEDYKIIMNQSKNENV